MKYSELVYERPDFEKVVAEIADATARLKNAATKEEFFAAIKEVDEIKNSNLLMLYLSWGQGIIMTHLMRRWQRNFSMSTLKMKDWISLNLIMLS